MTDAPVMELSVSDEARARIGTVITRQTSDPISMRHVREYLVGTDDRNPVYDLTQEGPIQVPPLVVFTALREVVYEDELYPDGQHRTLGVPGVTGRTLEGGTDYTFEHPIFIGDVLTMERTLVSIDEKDGRSGPLVIVTTRSIYRNQDDVVVTDFVHTLVFR